jgi:acylglycerol lipase
VKILPYPASDGAEFLEVVWDFDPAGTPEFRGTIIALHGMGSAASEFTPLGEYFSKRGWTVRAPNQRGNGYDPDLKRRGHAFSYQVFRADLLSYWMHLSKSAVPAFHKNPVYLFGESLGGLLSVNFIADKVLNPEPAGLILSAPVVELAHPNPPWIKHVVRFLAAVWPRLVISPSLFIQGKDGPVPLTRDEEYQAYVQTAPHRINAFTIRFTAGVAEIMDRTQKAAPLLQLPVLLLNGGGDVFIRPAQSAAWFSRIGSADKTHKVFPDSGHLLLHELNTAEVLATLEDWLESREKLP